MRNTFFFFLPFVFLLHSYHSPVRTGVLSTGAMEPHTLVGHGLNIRPGICPVVYNKHVKTLDWLVGTITDNYTSRMLLLIEMRMNTQCETRQCSHTSRIRLDLAGIYKLQVTSHRTRPLSYTSLVWYSYVIDISVLICNTN
jgi:hypothetical protein